VRWAWWSAFVSEADGNTAKMMELLAGDIRLWYRKAAALSPEELTARRYERFRNLGTPRDRRRRRFLEH
jgi:acetyl-CoA carboxylase alpha subunit